MSSGFEATVAFPNDVGSESLVQPRLPKMDHVFYQWPVYSSSDLKVVLPSYPERGVGACRFGRQRFLH